VPAHVLDTGDGCGEEEEEEEGEVVVEEEEEETSPLSDDFVTLVLLPLIQALPPPSLIDPVTAKAALALASANEATDAAVQPETRPEP